MKRILIIEDDIALNKGIALALRSESCIMEQACSLGEAKERMAKQTYDLLILDVNLPDGSGLTFLEDIRRSSGIPVILLTANDMETDVVTGLETGADDYVTKPFSLMVLRARVHTQLRRTPDCSVSTVLIDEFRFDFDKMIFFKSGKPLDLSKTEQKLLRVLVENKGITLQRAVLVDRIWTDGSQYVDENALSVCVKRLRDKLEDTPSAPTYIKTVYGIGYTWAVN